ncbi:polyprenyl synthetase family protein [Nocardiopsis protaetiae]|uniref:polyprenyl synthetase family protein n=1 Tax=Nocardiopsis protaetiae TaxID=3382270 RepID=UPI00387B4967
MAPVLNGRRPNTPEGDRVRGEVEATLRAHLDRRLREAEHLDTGFARDLADRTARFTLDGGKRLRPLLAWWGWRAGDGEASGPAARSALAACAALELVQTFALVHDDVMDGSTRRRGRPAVHTLYEEEHRRLGLAGEARRHGESLAVLVGDLALVWADDMLAEALPGTPCPRPARAVWRAIRTEMVAGQFLDVRGQAHRSRSETLALRIDLFKTAAYTVERPLHLGAAMAGADPAVVEALRGYGRDVGLAFQLADDLAGAYGDPGETGKPVGDDLREGKTTLLLALGTRLADERADTGAARVLARVGRGADPAEAAAALDRVGARARVRDRCRELAERGIGHLNGIDPPTEVRVALLHLAHRIGETT